MRDKIKGENLLISILVLLLIITLIASAFMPDSRPSTVRAELKRQGFSVEEVEFKYIEKAGNRSWIFESSEPIYYDGDYISLWLLNSRLIGMWPSMPRIENTVVPFQPED